MQRSNSSLKTRFRSLRDAVFEFFASKTCKLSEREDTLEFDNEDFLSVGELPQCSSAIAHLQSCETIIMPHENLSAAVKPSAAPTLDGSRSTERNAFDFREAFGAAPLEYEAVLPGGRLEREFAAHVEGLLLDGFLNAELYDQNLMHHLLRAEPIAGQRPQPRDNVVQVFHRLVLHYLKTREQLDEEFPEFSVADAVAFTRLGGAWWSGEESSTQFDVLVCVEELFHVFRFALAHDFAEAEVARLLEEDLHWRCAVHDLQRQTDYTDFHERLVAHYQHGYYGVDLCGRPVYYDRLQTLNLKRLFEDISQEELESYTVSMFEFYTQVLLPICSIKRGLRINRGITVLDLTGVTIKDFNKIRSILQYFISISQLHYPESMYKTYVLNAPVVARLLWNVVKSIVNRNTQKKIQFTSNWRDLTGIIAENQIPHFLKSHDDMSNRWCCFESLGPWMERECLERYQAICNAASKDRISSFAGSDKHAFAPN